MWAVRLVAIGAASWTGSFGSVMFMHYYVPLSWRGWISTFFLTIFIFVALYEWRQKIKKQKVLLKE
ncbi:hypothetical protein A3D71_02145 [Candidatus Kaiserbacteria bacterium RIFCSPHIGHO2_02_FULL_55_20]|uniref:Uncharacterized protein n=1 Tax=Candidatus Kaiserbacteria bacterium RIFCSPHIGHO2_02_FULL_55_20 TaxID=1798497 RepID=A0A1F6DX68_9BACT|nr:MAG: hypothetical protein A3D71_02145 [Candidatus Kaiserbacteria bacterium RIFCSPHIGHO2_02_FULL_55_20]